MKLLPIISLSLLFFAACKPDPPVVMEDKSGYPSDVAAIVNTNCALSGCHLGATLEGGLDLESWSKVMEGSDFGAVIVPFSPNWSHFFQHLNSFEELGVMATPAMPPTGDRLTQVQVQTIKDWIDNGAPHKDGTYRWAAEETQNGGKVFSLCAGSDLVAVTDLKSNLLMRFIEIGQQPDKLEAPHFIVMSPDQQFLYITFIESGGTGMGNSAIVEKYTTDTYERVGTVNVASNPALIQLNLIGTRAIISHFNDGDGTKLTLLDTENMVVLDEAAGSSDLLSRPHGLSATLDFETLYVAPAGGNYFAQWEIKNDQFVSQEKYVLDPSEGAPLASSKYAPYHCILLEADSLLFISNNKTNDVRVFHTRDHSLVKVIPVGAFPRLMTYDEVSKRIFVACANEENTAVQGSIKGCVSAIDVATLTEVKRIFGLGQRPHGVGIAPGRRQLYVTSENVGGEDPPHHVIDGISGPPGKYYIVDLTTLEVITDSETEIGVFPNALVVSP